jgi:hypothetical protein
MAFNLDGSDLRFRHLKFDNTLKAGEGAAAAPCRCPKAKSSCVGFKRHGLCHSWADRVGHNSAAFAQRLGWPNGGIDRGLVLDLCIQLGAY